MISIEIKSKIISQATHIYSDEENLKDFFHLNDIGVPLAQSVEYNLCELTEEGEEVIEETWQHLCLVFNKDPNGDYNQIDDLNE
jgi:hypothetical protein